MDRLSHTPVELLVVIYRMFITVVVVVIVVVGYTPPIFAYTLAVDLLVNELIYASECWRTSLKKLVNPGEYEPLGVVGTAVIA